MVKPSILELMSKIVRTKTRVSLRQTSLSKPLTTDPQKNNVFLTVKLRSPS